MAQRGSARLWRDLDSILRRSSPEHTELERSLARLLVAVCACGGAYGFFVGWHAVKSFGWAGLMQVGAAAVKVPLLFLLTLAVTFPSLYLFAALLDSPLTFRQALRLLLTAILVTLLAAASFGPILGFFTVSTESYAFMLLLNVALLGAAAVIGMAFLMLRIRAAEASAPERAATEAESAQQTVVSTEPEAPPPLPDLPPRVSEWARSRARAPQPARAAPRGSVLLQAWIVIYALVGMQMAWILRPFVGRPDAPLALFRPLGGNFFESLVHTLHRLVGI